MVVISSLHESRTLKPGPLADCSLVTHRKLSSALFALYSRDQWHLIERQEACQPAHQDLGKLNFVAAYLWNMNLCRFSCQLIEIWHNIWLFIIFSTEHIRQFKSFQFKMMKFGSRSRVSSARLRPCSSWMSDLGRLNLRNPLLQIIRYRRLLYVASMSQQKNLNVSHHHLRSIMA